MSAVPDTRWPDERIRLERRNAIWASLRLYSAHLAAPVQPGDTPAWSDPVLAQSFETDLRELQTLIGWSRERVLAGLGLTPADLPLPTPPPEA